MSNAGVDLFGFLAVFGVGAIWGLVWIVRLIVTIYRQRRGVIAKRSFREMAIHWGFEPFVMMLTLVLAIGGAWRGIRFLVSKPFVESYVAEVSSNQPVPSESRPDRWVGLHFIREAEILPGGVIRIITSHEGLADDAGYVYSPRSTPPVIGEDVYRHVIGPWYHWHRSW